MIGAIIGDIVGSIYEFDNLRSKEFKLFHKDSTFTDDTVMTIAVADFVTDEHGSASQARFVSFLHRWYLKYPNETYGAKFKQWISKFEDEVEFTDFKPYNSFGNGSAMRVSPIGALAYSIDMAKENSKFVTEVSHNHKEGVKGAEAVTTLIHLAKTEKDRNVLREYIKAEYGYDLNITVDELRETYEYNETCQRTVPEAMICFLESTDFEDSIRNAISIGGDSDTLACITGGIAEAYYQEIPEWIIKEAIDRLPKDIKRVLNLFYYEVQPFYPQIAKIILEQS